jgi:transcription factor SPN1
MKAHHQEMDAIIANLRPKRRRKKLTHEEEIIEEEQMEFKANDLVSKMVKAALDDLKLAMSHKFPIQKLNMLDEVEKKLSKINNADQFEAYCEVNLLGAVRSWLEPLGDGQLPPYHLVQKMLEFLNKMPIRTEHLETSYIGRIVFFYSKCKRTDVKIQRMADKLYMKWCRPILNISDDFRTSAKVLEFQNRGTSEGRGGLAAGAARKVKLSEFHKSLHKRLGQLGVKKAKGRAKSKLH